MYAKVEKSKYQKVTGNARAAILSGRFTASVTAQLLISYDVMDIRELNYLTLGCEFSQKLNFSSDFNFHLQLKQFPFSSPSLFRPLALASTFIQMMTTIHLIHRVWN
jgi:Reduced folate carrier